MLVVDKQKVKSGQILVILENPAHNKDVQKLKTWLALFHQDSGLVLPAENLILGDIQNSWTSFGKALADYNQFRSLSSYSKKISAIEKQAGMTHQYYDRLTSQKQILENDLKLGSNQYRRDSILFKQKVISSGEYEKSESAYLQKKYSFEGARVNLANTRIKLSQLEQDVLDLKLEYQNKKAELKNSLQQASENLNNQVETWEQTYILKSPIEGKINFNRYWSINQNVKKGETVLTVIPPKSSALIGRVSLPVQGAGKVKTGQKVNIRFANYPYIEYGLVRGSVTTISLVPTDNHYLVEVVLPLGLKTNYGKQLPFTQQMQGTAEIITEDIRLLQRMLNPAKYLVKKRFQD